MGLAEEIKSKYDMKQYEDVKKVVISYSGGLDTSVMAKLLPEVIGCEVVTVTLDLGQVKDLKPLQEKAESLGAEAHTVDAKKDFVENYIFPSVKANCMYEGVYPNSTAIARPCIVKHMIDIAHKTGADAIAHGCTGKGNDQVRFDIGIHALDPELKIIAPIREWNLWRDQELEYAKEKNIPVEEHAKKYSTDENLWGRSIECGELEHPDMEAPDEAFQWVIDPKKAPDRESYVNIYFEKGIPVEVESGEFRSRDPIEFIRFLTRLAGENGVGRIEHMEDRVVGLKTRESYEVPAALVVLAAHRDLEKYVFTRQENGFKPLVDKLWSELTYEGFWFSPLKAELDAFIDKSQEPVEGWAKIKLYKGHHKVVARDSKYALYDLNLATYEKSTTFDQMDSVGFIKLWGLNDVLANQVRKKR